MFDDFTDCKIKKNKIQRLITSCRKVLKECVVRYIVINCKFYNQSVKIELYRNKINTN